MTNPQWFLLETEQEYDKALNRYEEVKRAPKNSDDYKQKLLLVHLISEFEKENRSLPDVDPIELIKIRMADQ